jgi:hypothetical protein
MVGRTVPCQVTEDANRVAILLADLSGEEARPAGRPSGEDKATPCTKNANEYNATSCRKNRQKLARALPNPRPVPGGVPPCHSTGAHRQKQAREPGCG